MLAGRPMSYRLLKRLLVNFFLGARRRQTAPTPSALKVCDAHNHPEYLACVLHYTRMIAKLVFAFGLAFPRGP